MITGIKNPKGCLLMNKGNILTGLSIALMLALTGCVSESTDKKIVTVQTLEKAEEKPEVQKSNVVEEDLLRYINESLPPIFKQESEAIALYDSVSGPNYIDDETMYNKLIDEVIPKYRVFINNLELVEIETEELTEIHEIFIEAVNIQNSAFVTILKAIEEQDLEIMNEANAKLTEARAMIRDYQNKLDAFAEENNVIIKK